MIFKLRHQKTQQAIPVPPGSHVIGRDDQADLRFEDISISRRHARLTNDNNRILVEDLGSSNGTMVRNQRVTAATELKFGDLVEFGNAVFRVEPEIVGEIQSPPAAIAKSMVPVGKGEGATINRQTAKIDLPPPPMDPSTRSRTLSIGVPRAVAVKSQQIFPQPVVVADPAAAVLPKAVPVAKAPSVRQLFEDPPVPQRAVRRSQRIELPSPGKSGPISDRSASVLPANASVTQRQEPILPGAAPSGPIAPTASPFKVKSQPAATMTRSVAATATPPSSLPAENGVQEEVENREVTLNDKAAAEHSKDPFVVAVTQRTATAIPRVASPSVVDMMPAAQPQQRSAPERQSVPLWISVAMAFGAGIAVGILLTFLILYFIR